MKQLIMVLMTVMIGCGGYVSRAEHTKVLVELKQLQSEKNEQSLLLRAESEKFNVVLAKWSQDLANYVSSNFGAVVQVKVEEFVFIDGYRAAVFKCWSVETKRSVLLYGVMIKLDGEWQLLSLSIADEIKREQL